MSLNGHGANGASVPRRWANLFEITNPAELVTEYRLLEVSGLPRGNGYDKNLNQLVKSVVYGTKQPVALLRRGDTHYLAQPVDAPLPALEQPLMPHVARLEPRPEVYPLDLEHLGEDAMPIAQAFLRYALRTPLMRDRGLWSSPNGARVYCKQPLFSQGGAGIDVYPGFAWSVVVEGDGRLFLALDTCVRYVDRLWLPERLGSADARTVRGRHCLYHFGHDWYIVQFSALTGAFISEQLFLPQGRKEPVDVLTYTREYWKGNEPPRLRGLDPDDPAILYNYPGRREQKYGALGLCKLTYTTEHPLTGSLHGRSILDPTRRFSQIRETVARRFSGARLGGVPIRISTEPLEVERKVFPVPAQRFGQDRVLGVVSGQGRQLWAPGAQVTDTVHLSQLGQRRLRLLTDPSAGPLDRSAFHAQYVIMPQGLPREVNEDFHERFAAAMCEVSGRSDYEPRLILYDDRDARSLYQQVQTIERAVGLNGARRGYALLVLPERAKPDLHNYIKRDLWPDLQIQCATARKISGFYGGQPLAPLPNAVSKLDSYVRNCALGMMVANRRWAWGLATPLHYDVYVGIDVLNGTAGFTFIYGGGRHIHFRDYPSTQKEALKKRQIKQILVERLREDLTELGLKPRSLVIHRDGRSFDTELAGIRAAVDELKADGTLPFDATVGVVDVRKTNADHLRLAEGHDLEKLRNPDVGGYYDLGPREGIVCTTGEPFRLRGTVNPLSLVIVEGDLDIEWVLEDAFALSQLAFTAPDKCVRLPATIKLSDDFLEPIAGEADEDEAQYDDGDEEDAGEGEEAATLAAS